MEDTVDFWATHLGPAQRELGIGRTAGRTTNYWPTCRMRSNNESFKVSFARRIALLRGVVA